MLIVFVHGWSVTDTSTYGRLPETRYSFKNEKPSGDEIDG